MTLAPGTRLGPVGRTAKGLAITTFTDQLLFDVAISDDGESLLVARGPRRRDAQLITGF